jgi:hypothetical protein
MILEVVAAVAVVEVVRIQMRDTVVDGVVVAAEHQEVEAEQ